MDEEKDLSALEKDLQPPESSADAAADAPDAVAVEAPPDVEAESDLAEMAEVDGQPAADPKDDVEADAEAEMLAMLEDLPSTGPGATADDIEFGSASVAEADFQQLSEPAGQPSERSIDLLMDVNLPISIELGRTKLAISDILALGPGSVVELNKLAGEPVDLLVNYKIVARGEVVVIDENFGVRITQLLSAEERLRILGEQ